jgi:lysyl-tRNA synthetase class 2
MNEERWRPSATRAVLEQRAQLLADIRRFFAARAVLEVDTPIIVNHAVSDVHLSAARVVFERAGEYFLHTSPEYAMKRLLASGSGDIYQICHVARGFEHSRLHNPEFTLIEWYRSGFTLGDLMAEVEALLRAVCPQLAPGVGERLSYRDAFLRSLGLDPFEARTAELHTAAQRLGFTPGTAAHHQERDDLLDFLMAAHVGPQLGRDRLTFIHGYPASQAALARLDPLEPRTAQRFELYRDGVELANGFQELASSSEQRARFQSDNDERHRRGLPVSRVDEYLLQALAAGLPDCAGVALGFDRLLMLAAGRSHIDEVIAFPTERA